jgi:hypothetical protein
LPPFVVQVAGAHCHIMEGLVQPYSVAASHQEGCLGVHWSQGRQ